jgi:hypothetical protein
MKSLRRWVLLAVALVVPAMAGGCVSLFSMGLATPVPMQPWVPDRIEERLCHQNDHRAPILPPIAPGHRPLCEDQPDLAEILRAMPRVARGVPYIYEEFRDDISFTVEKVADHIDPPRFFPLIGPAQLHHCHWKCTVYYTETLESSYPFPFKCKRRRVQVVYIDKDHLHLCIQGPDAQLSVTRDVTNGRP